VTAQPYDTSRALKEPAGAWYRADPARKEIYLVFTAHDLHEGLPFVSRALKQMNVKASFFLTGDFVRNQPQWVTELQGAGHYLGPHSDRHLLYCDWTNRDSLLVSLEEIRHDLEANIRALIDAGVPGESIRVFMPPYEWYNRQVSELVSGMGIVMVNFSPGTSSNADYTSPHMNNYVSSDSIMQRIWRHEKQRTLNGFHLLIHVGTDPSRTDKLYLRLPELIGELREKGYRFRKFE